MTNVYSETRSSTHEIAKERNRNYASFTVTAQTAKVRIIMSDEYLVKMKKSLHLCDDIQDPGSAVHRAAGVLEGTPCG